MLETTLSWKYSRTPQMIAISDGKMIKMTEIFSKLFTLSVLICVSAAQNSNCKPLTNVTTTDSLKGFQYIYIPIRNNETAVFFQFSLRLPPGSIATINLQENIETKSKNMTIGFNGEKVVFYVIGNTLQSLNTEGIGGITEKAIYYITWKEGCNIIQIGKVEADRKDSKFRKLGKTLKFKLPEILNFKLTYLQLSVLSVVKPHQWTIWPCKLADIKIEDCNSQTETIAVNTEAQIKHTTEPFNAQNITTIDISGTRTENTTATTNAESEPTTELHYTINKTTEPTVTQTEKTVRTTRAKIAKATADSRGKLNKVTIEPINAQNETAAKPIGVQTESTDFLDPKNKTTTKPTIAQTETIVKTAKAEIGKVTEIANVQTKATTKSSDAQNKTITKNNRAQSKATTEFLSSKNKTTAKPTLDQTETIVKTTEAQIEKRPATAKAKTGLTTESSGSQNRTIAELTNIQTETTEITVVETKTKIATIATPIKQPAKSQSAQNKTTLAGNQEDTSTQAVTTGEPVGRQTYPTLEGERILISSRGQDRS